jgi:hypothetical protein
MTFSYELIKLVNILRRNWALTGKIFLMISGVEYKWNLTSKHDYEACLKSINLVFSTCYPSTFAKRSNTLLFGLCCHPRYFNNSDNLEATWPSNGWIQVFYIIVWLNCFRILYLWIRSECINISVVVFNIVQSRSQLPISSYIVPIILLFLCSWLEWFQIIVSVSNLLWYVIGVSNKFISCWLENIK